MIPKRLFWAAVGAAAGAGASIKAQRTVKKKIAPYAPENLPSTIAGGVRAVGDGVRDAVNDGRDAMHEHEARLRASLPTSSRRTAGATPLRAVPEPPDGTPDRPRGGAALGGSRPIDAK